MPAINVRHRFNPFETSIDSIRSPSSKAPAQRSSISTPSTNYEKDQTLNQSRAKQQAISQGATITNEFKLIKGFTYVVACCHLSSSTQDTYGCSVPTTQTIRLSLLSPTTMSMSRQMRRSRHNSILLASRQGSRWRQWSSSFDLIPCFTT